MSVDLSKLTSDDFKPHINQKFRLHHDGPQELTLELLSVTEVGHEPGPDEKRINRRAFSLVFGGSPEWFADQGIYRLEHPEIGIMDVFMVPIERQKYEVIFT
jgi:hypothetical protein